MAKSEQASRENLIKAMNAFATALGKGFNIDFNATVTDDSNRAETTGSEPSPFQPGYATGIRPSDFRGDSRFIVGDGSLSDDY